MNVFFFFFFPEYTCTDVSKCITSSGENARWRVTFAHLSHTSRSSPQPRVAQSQMSLRSQRGSERSAKKTQPQPLTSRRTATRRFNGLLKPARRRSRTSCSVERLKPNLSSVLRRGRKHTSHTCPGHFLYQLCLTYRCWTWSSVCSPA